MFNRTTNAYRLTDQASKFRFDVIRASLDNHIWSPSLFNMVGI